MCAAASVSPSAPTPVIARIWSVAQLPASRLLPVQARKRAGRGKNPFLFAMLFEKNIEIFSDPNPSVLCVFSICPPPFRAWGQGGSREAGAWAQDTVQVGINSFEARPLSAADAPISIEMTIKTRGRDASCLAYGSNTAPMYRYESAQRQAAETCPVHIWQPCILYLGNSA